MKRSVIFWNVVLMIVQIILAFISIEAFVILEVVLFFLALGIVLDDETKNHFWIWINITGILMAIILGIGKLYDVIYKYVITPINNLINRERIIKPKDTIDKKLKKSITAILAVKQHDVYLNNYAYDVFRNKYDGQLNVYYENFEVIDENTIRINYGYGDMTSYFTYDINTNTCKK